MKKYNLHEIMNKAWRIFKNEKALASQFGGKSFSFAEALKRAWSAAKCAVAEAEAAVKRAEETAKRIAEEKAKKAAAGIVRMHYSQYKAEYSKCQTVEGSYDKATKTIEVMTKTVRTFERPAYTAARTTRRPSVTAIRGLCPRCHTYCYGDCMA